MEKQERTVYLLGFMKSGSDHGQGSTDHCLACGKTACGDKTEGGLALGRMRGR